MFCCYILYCELSGDKLIDLLISYTGLLGIFLYPTHNAGVYRVLLNFTHSFLYM